MDACIENRSVDQILGEPKTRLRRRFGQRLSQRLLSAASLATLGLLGGWNANSATAYETLEEYYSNDSFSAPSTMAKLDMPGSIRFEPLIGIEVGGIALARDADASFPLVFSDGNSGPIELLETSDIIDPEMKFGARVSVDLLNICKQYPGLDVNVTYFENGGTVGNANLNAASYANTSTLVPQFFQRQPASPDAASTFNLESELESWEVTLGYRPVHRLRLSAGLRWIDLAEDFDILDTASLGTQVIRGFRSQVDNEAFGFQLGAEATLWSNDVLRFFWGGKYAYLNNDVTGDGIAQNAVIEFEDSFDSSLLEMEVGVSARIARWASLEIAYHGLQLYDVAGVMSQSQGLDILGSNDQKPASSDIGWHGFHFGINMMW